MEYGEESNSLYSDISDIDYTNYLFIQMEYAEFNLKDIQSNLTYEQKKDYFKQIVLGLNEIHSKNIIHRDLKPSNILIVNKKIKIGDFGLSRDINEKNLHISLDNLTEDLTGEMGTNLYSSPEQLSGEKYDYKTDIYSLGIIMFELLSNFNTEMEKHIEINKLKNFQDVDLGIKYPDELKFIKMLIHKQFDKRPSTEKILELL